MRSDQRSQLCDLADASSARPTRRRPAERSLAPLDFAPVWIGLTGTWGLAASIWPHSPAQRYSAIAAVAAAALVAWGTRAVKRPVGFRATAVAAAIAAMTVIGLRISGLTAVCVWGSGIAAALMAIGSGRPRTQLVRSTPPTRNVSSGTDRLASFRVWDWDYSSPASIVAVSVAEAAWWRTHSLALFGMVLAFSVLVAGLARGPRRWRALDMLLVRAGQVASTCIALALTAVVAIPLVYLPAWLHRAVGTATRRPKSPTWTQVLDDPARTWAERSRMFASPNRPRRRNDREAVSTALDRSDRCDG